MPLLGVMLVPLALLSILMILKIIKGVIPFLSNLKQLKLNMNGKRMSNFFANCMIDIVLFSITGSPLLNIDDRKADKLVDLHLYIGIESKRPFK
jgi:hypothetical protein